VVKPATVACGSVCRQKQNCRITKKQIEKVRRQMPGASRREVAEAIKKAMEKKRQGMGTAGALYEGTREARSTQGKKRIEARKRKGEQAVKPQPSPSTAKKAKAKRGATFKDSTVEIAGKRGDRLTVPSKRIGDIHLVEGRLGHPTMVVGGNEVKFATKKGAAAVAKAFHALIQESPTLQKTLQDGGRINLESASESQYLFNRAMVAAEKELGPKESDRVDLARKQIGWHEEYLSQ